MQTGFIKSYRSFLEWEWYTEPNTFRVFFHLLHTVNYTDKSWRGIEVKAGQKITSIQHLADELNLTPRKIRTALDNLKSTGEITIKTTNKYSLVTIENWGLYQCNEQQCDNQNDKRDATQTTVEKSLKSQANDNQTTTTKECKNDKNDKNKEYAYTVITYLNEKTGKSYKHDSTVGINSIKPLIKEKVDIERVKKVIDYKCWEWLEKDNMAKNLNPTTLFRQSNFFRYEEDMQNDKKYAGGNNTNIQPDRSTKAPIGINLDD